MKNKNMRRRKTMSSAGICRCAACILIMIVSALGTLLALRAIMAARWTLSQRDGFEDIERKKQGHALTRSRRAKQTADSLLAAVKVPSPEATTTTHVVIASFGEPEPYHAVSLYFASKLFGATVHHVIMHTYGKGHEPGELNLKTAREEEGADGAAERGQAANSNQQEPPPSVPWRTIYRRLRVHRHDVDLSIEKSYDALARSYLHSSAREVDYELLCFARFIGLHLFCTERGIDELTFLDADVIVFDREFLKKVRIPANHSLWTLHDHSSFLASMTCSSIGDFVDYMVAFYQQPDRRSIVSTIDTFGDDEINSSRLQWLRDREPAFDALGAKPKLFTDMYLFDLFLHDQLAHSRVNEESGGILRNTEGSNVAAELDKTPQATKLPPRSMREEEREETRKRDPKTSRKGATIAETRPILPPYVHNWNAPTEQSRSYFYLLENMRSVTQVPHTHAWLCLDESLFGAHFRINITSQSARINGGIPDDGGGRSFQPLPGAHFQGDCKSKLKQLLYDDVVRAIEEMAGV